MALQIQSENTDSKTLRLTLEGQLDTLTAPELEKSLQTLLVSEIKTLIFDLKNLSFVSSAGLRVFAKTRKTMKSREGNLYFMNLSSQVKKVFDIVKAVPLNEVFLNTEELDDYLLSMQTKTNEA